jgi:hypothetical protein
MGSDIQKNGISDGDSDGCRSSLEYLNLARLGARRPLTAPETGRSGRLIERPTGPAILCSACPELPVDGQAQDIAVERMRPRRVRGRQEHSAAQHLHRSIPSVLLAVDAGDRCTPVRVSLACSRGGLRHSIGGVG